MKITDTALNVQSNAPSAPRQANIKISAKAFDILSSGIYSDAVTAVCRELGTNAADAHKEAGCPDKPFSVKLPTSFYPFFSVKDSGTGIPKDRMEEMYLTYFESSRSNSDDFTGCLGLGSKSPLAIIDNFLVTSTHNGWKGTYSIYKGEDGAPAIRLLQESTTDDHNGVEVKVPVTANQFKEFETKAKAVYKWFNPLPDIPGLVPLTDLSLGDEDFRMPHSILYENRQFGVLMGNVFYELSENDFAPFKSSLNATEQLAIKCEPTLLAGIGEVDIATSRESLKFTEKTRTALRRHLSVFVMELARTFEERLAASKSMWDARCVLSDFLDSSQVRTLIQSSIKPVWKGQPIEIAIPARSEKEEDVRLTKFYFAPSERGRWNSNPKMLLRSDKRHGSNYLHADWNVHILLPDMKTGNITALKDEMHRHKSYEPVYYLLEPNPEHPERLQQWLDKHELQDIVVKASSLPQRPKEPRATKDPKEKKKKTYRFLEIAYGDHSPAFSWIDRDIDIERGGVYVEVNGFYWTAGNILGNLPSTGHKPADLRRLIKETESITEITRADVFGVRRAAIAKIEKNPKWVRLDHMLQNTYAKNHGEIRIALGKATIWEDLKKLEGSEMLADLFERRRQIKKDTLLWQAVEAFHDIRFHYESEFQAAAKFLVKYLDIDFPTTGFEPFHTKAKSLFKRAVKRYPLLSHISILAYRGVDQMLAYARLIDRDSGDAPNPAAEHALDIVRNLHKLKDEDKFFDSLQFQSFTASGYRGVLHDHLTVWGNRNSNFIKVDNQTAEEIKV